MAAPFTFYISPLVDVFAVMITGIAGYYIYRQKTTAYQNVRVTLIFVYVFAVILVLFEIYRILLSSSSTIPAGPMSIYTDGSTTLILVNAWLLSVASIGVYLKPSKGGFRQLYREVRKRDWQSGFLLIFTALVVFSALYLTAFSPYSVTMITNLWGDSVFATTFSPFFVLLLGIILFLYLGYPTPLLVFAARQVKNHAIRRSLIILAVCWAAIGLDFFIFDGYFWSRGLDANDVMYAVFAVTFSVTAIIFRNASTLAGFFELKAEAIFAPPTTPVSKGLPKEAGVFQGKSWLMEIDPSVAYEQTVKKIAIEASGESIIFAFTSRGTPIYKSLLDLPNVRFYLMTPDVSYMKPTAKQTEILIPQNDSAIMLQLLSKTVSSTSDRGATIIFDNITDSILSSGLETTYKFLKQANQIVSEPRVTSLFLITTGAHDERTEKIIRSLFSDHAVHDKQGFRITRG